MRHRVREFGLLAVWSLLAFHPGVAQQKAGVISGRVTDRTTGNALASAEIILLSDSRSVTADSLGRYVFTGFPSGVSQLLVRAIQFQALNLIVEVRPGEELELPIRLDSAVISNRTQTLSTVAVTASAPAPDYRMIDFERRRQTGRGQYLTEDDLIRRGSYRLQDAVQSMRGVIVDCGDRAGCRIHMARAQANCSPMYVVDGVVDNVFGPATPIRDIVGIEVYTGASDVPGEFAGSSSGCGVIALWTRSGPRRK